MSPYTPLPQTSTTPKAHLEHEQPDLLQGLQDIPSNFDLALNGGTARTYRTTKAKAPDASLLDPEAFRRLSISTASSLGGSRGVSPFPQGETIETQPWRNKFSEFLRRNQGLFLVSFSQLFGAGMNVTTRLLELEDDGMHPFQILFARQSLTMIFCSLWMWWTKVPGFPLGPKGVRGLLVARSFSGFFGIYGMYYSLQYLPVADAVVITFLAPSVASYGCWLLLREPFPRSSQYASLVSLLGVVLIARPTSFFTSSPPPSEVTHTNTTSSSSHDFPTPTSAQRLSAILVALLGVLGAAGAFTSIRWIGHRAHPLLSVNYFSTFCTIISILALTLSAPLNISSTLHFALPANLRQWSMLIFLGCCGFIMQFLLTKGLAAGGRGGGAKATHMIYTNMLFALAFDRWIFGVVPGWWSLAGSGLILGSAIWIAVGKGKGHVEDSGSWGTDEDAGGLGIRGREIGDAEEEMGMLSSIEMRSDRDGDEGHADEAEEIVPLGDLHSRPS